MSEKKTYRIFNVSGCLTGEAMVHFIKKSLPDTEMQQIETHINQCEFCRDALEGAGMLDHPETLFAVSNELHDAIDKRLKKDDSEEKSNIVLKRIIPFSVAASIAIAFGLFIIFYDGNKPKLADHTKIEQEKTGKMQDKDTDTPSGTKENIAPKEKTDLPGTKQKQAPSEKETNRKTVLQKTETLNNKTKGLITDKEKRDEQTEGFGTISKPEITDEIQTISEEKDMEETKVSEDRTDNINALYFESSNSDDFVDETNVVREDEESEINNVPGLRESEPETIVMNEYRDTEKKKDVFPLRAKKSRSAMPDATSRSDKSVLKTETFDEPEQLSGGQSAKPAMFATEKNIDFQDFIQEKADSVFRGKTLQETGQIVVSFYINATGDAKQLTIEKGLTTEINNTIIHLVRTAPKWKPAMQDGTPVNTKKTIMINVR